MKLSGRPGYYLIQNSFDAIEKVNGKYAYGKEKGLGLGWATRVKAGKMSDRIVAKKKGFKLKPNKNELDF